MKSNLFLIIVLTLSFLIFITSCLVSCSPVTSNENNATETTTTEDNTTEIETTEIETVFNISIANGSGVSGFAKKTAELFKAIKYPSGIDKYNITHITNANNYNYENTKIICKSGGTLLAQAAEDIKTILKAGIITTSNEVSEDTDIAIIIGKDYSLPTDVEITEDDKKDTPEIKYEIIYTLNNLRYDDAITYYVLIDPIDLSNDSFKEDVKEVIRNIVEEKGNKITIEIFDKMDSLENGYKDGKFDEGIGDLEEWDNWFKDEIVKDLAIHSIATYDGELENWFFFNTLCFFMYSDYLESTIVDKYAETIEFNPYVEEQVTNSEDEKEQEDSSSLLEQIKISGEAQDIYNDELKIVIWVKNESNKTFSGYIMIEFYDNKNKIIWQDWSSYTWDFKTEVPPGESSYCIMWIPLEKGYPVNIRSRVKDYKFY
ncbi:hypothetical protein ES707_01746 [subsurface metagenome]